MTIYSQTSNGATDWNTSTLWNTAPDGSGTPSTAAGNNLVVQNGDLILINSDLIIESLTIEEGGDVRFDGLDVRSIIIQGDVTIDTNATFRVQTSGNFINTMTIEGNLLNEGTFDMAPVSTRVCDVTFNKNGNQTVSGSGILTRFNKILLDMNSDINNILEITTVIELSPGGLTITSGTFKLSSASTITPFSGSGQIIPSDSRLHLNNIDALCQKGSSGGIEVFGVLRIETGTFEAGSSTSSELTLNGSNAQLIINNGTVNVLGRLRQVNSSSIEITGGELNLSTDGSINIGSRSVLQIPQGSSILMSGGILKIFNANQNSSGGDIKITTSSGNINFNGGDFVIGNGASTSGNIQVNINGNINNLIIDAGTTIPSLTSDLNIDGDLTLTSGILALTDYNLNLGDSSSINGTASNSKFIEVSGIGELRKTFNSPSSFNYPIGDTSGTFEYSPATLNFTSGIFSLAFAGVNLRNIKHPNNTSANDFINRYWTVNSNGISSFSCDVIFKYADNDISGTEASLYSGSWNGANWSLMNPAETISNQLSGSVSSFSDFTGGEPEVLPVELKNFSMDIINNKVKLLWQTITEVNSYGFEIEKCPETSKGKWQKIGFVRSKGNSNTINNYEFFDESKNFTEKIYYRLKQIDNNGNFKYSKIVKINFNIEYKFELSQNYPNPFNPSTNIRYSVGSKQFITLKIYDILGNEIITLVNKEQQAGNYEAELDASKLPSGIYFYKLKTADFVLTKKMILLK
ncbi:MAG: T9SS type A sorting domain-containing protein [Ignavibacteriaceae bacterium]